MRIHLSRAVLSLAVLLVSAPAAHAVDGQVLINQARAMSGGVTPGDAPGFPVTISEPGSYRLSSNLVVPNNATTAIEIAASNVTLDLNGFAILGPANGTNDTCGITAVGSGIATAPGLTGRSNITVRNGAVQGVGCVGILLAGSAHLVEYVHVQDVFAGGISLFPTGQNSGLSAGSIVQHSTVERAAFTGITVVTGVARHNVVANNGSSGITVFVGTIAYNVVSANGIGLSGASTASFIGNVLRGNGENVLIDTVINMGQNLCDTAPCPNARF